MSLHSLAADGSFSDEDMNENTVDIVDEDEESNISLKKADSHVMKPPLPIPSSIELSKPPVRITPLVSYARDDESDSDTDESDKEEIFDLHLLYKRKAEQLQEQASNASVGERSPASAAEDSELNPEELNFTKTASNNALDQVRLPPEPEGRCSRSLQDKIARMLEKKNLGKLSLNEHVQRKKDFRNPSIYEKLVNYCSIDEYGTNYPRNLFNPSSWGVESYYDALAKAQKEAHEKKEKEKHQKGQVEFIKATKKLTTTGSVATAQGTDDKSKSSKWDSKSGETGKHSIPGVTDVPVKKQKAST